MSSVVEKEKDRLYIILPKDDLSEIEMKGMYPAVFLNGYPVMALLNRHESGLTDPIVDKLVLSPDFRKLIFDNFKMESGAKISIMSGLLNGSEFPKERGIAMVYQRPESADNDGLAIIIGYVFGTKEDGAMIRFAIDMGDNQFVSEIIEERQWFKAFEQQTENPASVA